MSISREILNHPSTYVADNSGAASCTKAFLTPSYFLTLSNTSDTEVNQEREACYYIFVYATLSLELDPKLFEGRDRSAAAEQPLCVSSHRTVNGAEIHTQAALGTTTEQKHSADIWGPLNRGWAWTSDCLLLGRSRGSPKPTDLLAASPLTWLMQLESLRLSLTGL